MYKRETYCQPSFSVLPVNTKPPGQYANSSFQSGDGGSWTGYIFVALAKVSTTEQALFEQFPEMPVVVIAPSRPTPPGKVPEGTIPK